MQHKCEFPACTKMSIKMDRHFKKFHCEKHDFDSVVWPIEVLYPETINRKKEKRSSSTKFGKKYYFGEKYENK